MLEHLTILIPAYNESSNILNVLEELAPFVRSSGCKVIVINDGSTDDTASVVANFCGRNTGLPVKLIAHSRNRGYGAAIKSGVRATDTQYLVTIDADGQHALEDIDGLYSQFIFQEADLCIGNRQGKGSTPLRNSLKRVLLWVVNFFLKTNFSDLNSGMKLYRTEIVKRLIPFTPNGMPFSDAIVLLHQRFRFKIIEHPIRVRDRAGGKSTINYKTGIYTIAEVMNLVINFFPFKFFLYVSVFLFVLGAIWGIPYILLGKGLTTGASFIWLTSLNLLFFGIILENTVRLRYDRFEYPESKAIVP